MGFVKYQQAIAPAPWTIPSHASLFTGLMPSGHGIHEGRSFDYQQLSSLSKSKLGKGTLINYLVERGYSTFGLVCNPFVTQSFGYEFDETKEFDRFGEDPIRTRRYRKGREHQKILRMISAAKVELLKTEVSERLLRAAGMFPLEKGSRFVAAWVRTHTFRPPFFLFVNLMEAHGPYTWHDYYRNWGQRVVYSHLTGRPFVEDPGWASLYPRSARFAVFRGLSLVRRLVHILGDSLVIVTSDHGQLIGERQRYDHNYFLDDELLKIPLYVRFPDGVSPLKQNGGFISLAEIPKMIDGVVDRKIVRLGSDVALAESFGPHTDLAFMGKTQAERRLLDESFFRRVKIYTRRGSVTFNGKTGEFEESRGTPSISEAEAAMAELPSVSEEGVLPPAELSPAEAQVIESRLKDLGYL
jgi:hypothetical protein